MRSLSGQLAQLVEQRIENPRVRGSIPRLATKILQVKTPTYTVGVFAFTLAKLRGPVHRRLRGLFGEVFGSQGCPREAMACSTGAQRYPSRSPLQQIRGTDCQHEGWNRSNPCAQQKHEASAYNRHCLTQRCWSRCFQFGHSHSSINIATVS